MSSPISSPEIHATVAQQVDAWRRRSARRSCAGRRRLPDRPAAEAAGAGCGARRSAGWTTSARHPASARHGGAHRGLAADLVGAAAFRDPGDLAAAESLLARARKGAVPPAAPSPLWRLADWIEGPSARVALEASRAVIWSRVPVQPAGHRRWRGAGKTHLLHSLGNAIWKAVRVPVACLSAPEYSGELIAAIDRDAVGIGAPATGGSRRSSSTTCT